MVDQHYLFTSVLTIFFTYGNELRIECSSDLFNDVPQEVQFYNEVPGNVLCKSVLEVWASIII